MLAQSVRGGDGGGEYCRLDSRDERVDPSFGNSSGSVALQALCSSAACSIRCHLSMKQPTACCKTV